MRPSRIWGVTRIKTLDTWDAVIQDADAMNNETRQNNNEPREPFGNTYLGTWLGLAFVILAICIGIGGCCHLAQGF